MRGREQSQSKPDVVHGGCIKNKILWIINGLLPNFPGIGIMEKQNAGHLWNKKALKWYKEGQGTFLCISIDLVGKAPTQLHQKNIWILSGTLSFQIIFQRNPVPPNNVEVEGASKKEWPSIVNQYPELTL